MAKKEIAGNYAVPGITGTATTKPTTSPVATSTGSSSAKTSTSSKTTTSNKSTSSGSSGSGVSSAYLTQQLKNEQEAQRLAQGQAALDALGGYGGSPVQMPQYQTALTAGNLGAATDIASKTPDYSFNFQQTPAALAYADAMKLIQKDLHQGAPKYENPWDAELENSYNAIVNRPAFDYNADEDPYYKQYEQRYTDLGQRAMRDTIGQTAALTGGYSNTYSQYAGQESYNAYMAALADKGLELEQRAYDRWRDVGDDLYRQYQMVGDLADTFYGRYRDAISDYNHNLSLLQTQEQEDYARQKDAHDYQIMAEKEGYARSRDAMDDLKFIDETGYERFRDYYNSQRQAELENYNRYAAEVDSIIKLYS